MTLHFRDLIPRPITTMPGPCDRCGRHRDHLHRTPLGWVCAPCILGNPDIAIRRRKTLRSKRKEVARCVEWDGRDGARTPFTPGLTTSKEWLG